MWRRALIASAVMGLFLRTARADVVLSMNDNHTVLDAQANQVAPNPVPPDTVDVIDVSSFPPRIVSTFEAPGSVVGPPLAVWVAPDESWAISTAATKADPQGKFGISPDDRVSVVDLKANPPRIIQTTHAGAGATVVRVSPDGSLALVCNRTEGTVSIFTVKDHNLEPAGKLDLGKGSGPSSVVFLPDGKTALLTRNFDNQVSVLHIDGAKLTVDPRPITTGVAPYTMDINAAGTLAAVSNMGRGDGDLDTVSLIDLTQKPMRTVETVGVPSGPEPLKFSPDGRFLAVGSQEGSTKVKTSPFFHDQGNLQVFIVQGSHLERVAGAPVVGWAEGVVCSRDGKTVMFRTILSAPSRCSTSTARR
ncbi:MAG: beta-propeller fold lactonase family protein [Acetobacteraceae bacterium]|nr:beta-propeller fold lactonase family protein [Acetobacteraceae bacterium]